MTNNAVDFQILISHTWRPWEAEGLTEYAERVERGETPRPELTLPHITPETPPKPWLEDWKERGRPVA